MKMLVLRCALFCSFALGAGYAQLQGHDSLAQRENVATALHLWQTWAEEQMAYRGQPGMAVGIVYDQQLVWSHGFGISDTKTGQPVTPQTNFRIASISKVFTATAILQLRDAGKLRLEDPVVQYLPWFRLRGEEPNSKPITIWDLLTHTAGLPRESDFGYWTDGHFPTQQEMIDMLAKQEVVFPPETRYKYSDLGFAVAGEIVSAVSGESYEDYVRQHILVPLGMTTTSFPTEAKNDPSLATGYGRRMPDGKRAIRAFADARALNAAAGLSSNVDDLARFIMLQFRDGSVDGTTVLQPSSLREMHRVQWLQPDWGSGVGLGFSIQHTDLGAVVGHGGTFQGYKTNISFIPELKIGIIVLTNADDGDPSSYIKQFFAVVAPELAKAIRPLAKPMPPDPQWSRYVGKYRNAWSDIDVVVVGDALVLMDPQSPDLKHSYLKLVPVGINTFRLTGDNPSAPIGELVVFELDSSGEVKRVKIGSDYIYPLR